MNVITIRPRAGVDLVALLRPLVAATAAAPAPPPAAAAEKPEPAGDDGAVAAEDV